MPKIQLADAELRYVENGEGESVVLVHGGLANFRLWGRLSEALSQKFRVISYSRRGYFPNEVARNRSSGIPLHSADLSSLISQLSKVPVHLVGESYGAYVVTHCALHYPDRVRSLWIDEPPILPLLLEDESDREDLQYFESEVLEPAIEYYAKGRPEDAARVLLGFLEEAPDAYDSLPKEIRKIIVENSEATSEDLKGGFNAVKREELPELRAPSLLMKSEHGPKILKRLVDHLHELIPHNSLIEIEGTTHGTIIDSSVYCDRVLEFLGGL